MGNALVLKTDDGVWFAKNSNRKPGEPQRIRFYPAGEITKHVNTSNMDVVPVRHLKQAVIISQPDGLWGAEMGINAAGVAIGSVSVHTKLSQYSSKALPGVDLVRLALEQGVHAENALDIIIHYLEKYGQTGLQASKSLGDGDCNFLITDAHQAWKLETAGRFWAAKKVDLFATLSNCTTLQTDYNRSYFPAAIRDLSKGKNDFQATFGAFFTPWKLKADHRDQLNQDFLNIIGYRKFNEADGFELFREQLSRHDSGTPQSNRDICMHSGAWSRTLETSNSMIAHIPRYGESKVWFTGCPHPCKSEFHGVSWGKNHFFADKPDYWEENRSNRK